MNAAAIAQHLNIAESAINMSNNDLRNELGAIHRENRRMRLEKNTEISEMNQKVPFELLQIRDPEARAKIAKLKGLSIEKQIQTISQIPSYRIQSPGVKNDEINAILEYLDSPVRAGFAHGYSSKNQFGGAQSSWGYFDKEKSIYHSFVECRQPPDSISALVFLLKLSESVIA